jgi:hypothetical protein
VPDVAPKPRPDQYELALAVIDQIKRAIASPEFYEGVMSTYRLDGRDDQADIFAAAVEEQRRFAEDEQDSEVPT